MISCYTTPSFRPDPGPGHRARSSRKEVDVARFQLVFRDRDGDRVETHDNSDGREPRLLGVVLVDGASFVRRETIWLATRDDLLDNYGEIDMVRFICNQLAAQTQDSHSSGSLRNDRAKFRFQARLSRLGEEEE